MEPNLAARDRAVAIVVGNHKRGLATNQRSLVAVVEPGLGELWKTLAWLRPPMLSRELKIDAALLRDQSPWTLAALWMLAASGVGELDRLTDAGGRDIQPTITTTSRHAALHGCVVASNDEQVQIAAWRKSYLRSEPVRLNQPETCEHVDDHVLEEARRSDKEPEAGQLSAWFAASIAERERIDLRDAERAFPLSFELARTVRRHELGAVLARRDSHPVRGAVPRESVMHFTGGDRRVHAAITLFSALRTPTMHDDGALRFPLVGQQAVFALWRTGVGCIER